MGFFDKSIGMQEFLDNVATGSFGISITYALNNNICVSCKKPIDFLNMKPIDVKEYEISGLCPKCFMNLI